MDFREVLLQENNVASTSKEIIDALKEQQLKLAIAESITGGHVSNLFVLVPGASEVLEGSLTAYSNRIKVKLLGVNTRTIANFGAVSKQTALEMVQGARRLFDADVAIATTGFAGPVVQNEKVGRVFIAVSIKNIERAQEFLFEGTREEIIEQAGLAALSFLKLTIKENVNVR